VSGRIGFSMASRSRSYLGLVPLENSSGNRRPLGHITKQGNSLSRFLLVEAAQVTVRSDPEWRTFRRDAKKSRPIHRG
jgi:transposase